MTEPDTTRPALRGWWQALIDGTIERERAVDWAQQRLSTDSWVDEVTHQGLQILNDYGQQRWTIASGLDHDRVFLEYWDWMETVQQFEDDPAAWNRAYARRFVSGLPAHLRERAAASFGLID
ncbi:hypothetical protein SAMN02800687_1508 [Curtobacterium sp. UNCCL20]|uniref:hypothetical protein n=1 Tax=Curtobacterium sp. UNCCL20 TaxID=1502773 RepID=UPI000889D557|nr:hypothetical protein [Curtobacterium sp. UNCCL20]SDQ34482.1 hypothetical protein SAMN02800687_1508 [Curtobacterium sp. UNCCL20]